jgi:hypothetical protein
MLIFVCQPVMKQAVAASLLLVQLFTLGGYRLLFRGFEHRAERRMAARIDDSRYDERLLREIRVPVNLPYQIDWPDFEPYSGDIEIGGVHYSYVKRRLVRDTMVLLVLPNTDRMRVTHARETFYALVNDLERLSEDGPVTPPPAKPVKPFSSEYPASDLASVPSAPCPEPSVHLMLPLGHISAGWQPSPFRPPGCLA